MSSQLQKKKKSLVFAYFTKCNKNFICEIFIDFRHFLRLMKKYDLSHFCEKLFKNIFLRILMKVLILIMHINLL